MDYYDKRNVWVGAIVVGLVLMIVGGCIYADNARKEREAEVRVAELAAACQRAEVDYLANWESATREWQNDQRVFADARQFQLGDLKVTRTTPQGITDTCGSALTNLQGWLNDGTDRVKIYDIASDLIYQLNQVVGSAMAELQMARDAKGRIEAVEIYAWYTVKDHVYNPPFDAVNPLLAQSEFNEGMARTTQAWRHMANSDWRLARNEADMAYAWLASAYNNASSPTPTPEPTNTPWPTNTPEPYNPPPQTNFDWSSDDDSGDDSGSWDSGGSDSGSWDSDGSDSGSWDSGSDSGSWDSGGSDSGSWDSGGSDSGSWKVAPRVTPTPQRVLK